MQEGQAIDPKFVALTVKLDVQLMVTKLKRILELYSEAMRPGYEWIVSLQLFLKACDTIYNDLLFTTE